MCSLEYYYAKFRIHMGFSVIFSILSSLPIFGILAGYLTCAGFTSIFLPILLSYLLLKYAHSAFLISKIHGAHMPHRCSLHISTGWKERAWAYEPVINSITAVHICDSNIEQIDHYTNLFFQLCIIFYIWVLW